MDLLTKDFDKYSTIIYKDVMKPFWRTYAYKIVVVHSVSLPTYDYYENADATEWNAARNERRRFLYNLLDTCPTPDREIWKHMNCGRTINFYFKHSSDAAKFIDQNTDHITEVHRPFSEGHVQTFEEDHINIVRDNLFWGKYRYCICFKKNADRELDEWAEDYWVHQPSEIASYVYSDQRRLYLNNIRDIVFARLGMHEHITRIEKIILKSEILDNAFGISSEAR